MSALARKPNEHGVSRRGVAIVRTRRPRSNRSTQRSSPQLKDIATVNQSPMTCISASSLSAVWSCVSQSGENMRGYGNGDDGGNGDLQHGGNGDLIHTGERGKRGPVTSLAGSVSAPSDTDSAPPPSRVWRVSTVSRAPLAF